MCKGTTRRETSQGLHSSTLLTLRSDFLCCRSPHMVTLSPLYSRLYCTLWQLKCKCSKAHPKKGTTAKTPHGNTCAYVHESLLVDMITDNIAWPCKESFHMGYAYTPLDSAKSYASADRDGNNKSKAHPKKVPLRRPRTGTHVNKTILTGHGHEEVKNHLRTSWLGKIIRFGSSDGNANNSGKNHPEKGTTAKTPNGNNMRKNSFSVDMTC